MEKLYLNYLTGMKTLATEKNDMDRLKFMPQKIEGQRLVNFHGDYLTTVIDGLEDGEIFDKDKILNGKRCTPALVKSYFESYDKLITTDEEVTETTNDKPTLEDDLLDAVEAGDKKAVRAILKELKEKWFALDDDKVEEAIDDIKDCVSDKDVKEVEAILDSLEPADEDTILKENIAAGKERAKLSVAKENDERKKVKENIAEARKGAKKIHSAKAEEGTPTTTDDNDIVLDIVDAIKDEDIKDVEMLLKELGEDHPRYKEFNISLATLKGEDAIIETESDPITNDDDIDAIIGDLEDAIEAKEFEGEDGAKEILAELLELVGAEDEDYIKYDAIVNPPVEDKKSRRSRRGK